MMDEQICENPPQNAETLQSVVDFCASESLLCKNLFDLKVRPQECGEFLISELAGITSAPGVPK